ncbi:MAG: type II toxin-antitoxin system VapC family toxin [Oculatellaceae cyanobacterium Prado106]|jgi:predicted nucleic acid-binding protein|nr:type II toxin-antitoxin system VapC family toxin [Oculatellaceae cyanobacterium Prado106]
MDIVVDANLLVALATQHPQRQIVYQQFASWIAQQDVVLHAPDLAYAEVTNALTRMITAKMLSRDQVQAICQQLMELPIQYHIVGVDPDVIDIALRLSRKTAYDAVYLVLVQRLGAVLWTLDSPLYRNAIGQGYSVRLLGEIEQS